jgi:hypothetical protein
MIQRNKIILSIFVLSLSLLFVQCKAKSAIPYSPVADTVASKQSLVKSDTIAKRIIRPHTGEYNSHTLIIFYDVQIGNKALLKAVQSYGAKILYQYKNFNGIAISIPDNKTLDESITYFQKVKGVLSVNKDRIYHLD